MKATRKTSVSSPAGVPTPQQARFRAFSRLAERAGEGRPLLRGLRLARDPKADRFVVVHAGARVEFALAGGVGGDAGLARLECRGLDASGKAEATPLARFAFGDDGLIAQSTFPELLNEAIDQSTGAWSVVAAVLWSNMHARDEPAS